MHVLFSHPFHHWSSSSLVAFYTLNGFLHVGWRSTWSVEMRDPGVFSGTASMGHFVCIDPFLYCVMHTL